jgi:hypothetical protein
VSPAPSGAAAALLRSACGLGLVAAALTVADTMTTVLGASAGRDALERAYVARSGSSAELASAVIGSALAGAFVVGLLFAAAIAALALLARTASRGVRTGLVICTLLALPGAFAGPWALGRALALVAALACVLARPAAAAFTARRAPAGARSPGGS